ncbi:4'-phosphopantetheinyl transferase superfamily protein [Kitasatospora sp. NA04385]|uniref:4'-phosphopantetheinyl transferase family protein n=1 Tax=Kitasatospora sp. NA04385 TaxID=2742135 RepID=UPI0015914AFB|nr:4'-phosphopantetheinyl transferase superfamily protein [Kitasatospora sp. NA04385]QKW23078.1 4'-phosphopantetheinyl transferase superfamily protein [Kitasatospora sp. NA04385]
MSSAARDGAARDGAARDAAARDGAARDGAARDAAAAVDVVEVWSIPTDQPPDVVHRLYGLLGAEERERADRARDPRQGERFAVARGAVRLLVAARLGTAPADLAWRYGPHGKPAPVLPASAEPIRVNWSGSGALALLALAVGRRVGADVERLARPAVGARIARRHFPPADAALVLAAPTPADGADRFTRLWCRREACVKVHGGRLAQGLGLPLAGPSPLRLADAAPLGPGPLWLADVPVPGPYRAAVAVDADRPFTVRHRTWSA